MRRALELLRKATAGSGGRHRLSLAQLLQATNRLAEADR